MSVDNEVKIKANAPVSERGDRLKKLEEIKKTGINPYPAKVKRDFEINQVLTDFDSLTESAKEFYIVGRLRSKREHGNLAFANLEDASGSIQLAFSKKDLGADTYKNFLKFIFNIPILTNTAR